MGRLHVHLFGRFDAGYEDEPGQPARHLRGLDARKLQECFSYLLLHRNHVFPREVLAELITPEMPAEQSRKGLRQVLWQLQSALAAPGAAPALAEAASSPADGDRLLIVDAEWVYVNPDFPLWLDVAELDDVFAGLVGQAGEGLCAEVAERVRCAVGLYRGDLLEGWYSEWCLLERERLQNAYLALLDKLMGYSAAHSEYEAGLVYGQTILGYDRARERTHQRMMELHWLAGDRTSALRQYQACTAALHEELDVAPSRRTTELYERIARGDSDAVPGARPDGTSGTRSAGARTAGAQTPQPGALEAAGPQPEARLRASFLALVRLQRQVNHQVSELSNLLDANTSSTPTQPLQ